MVAVFFFRWKIYRVIAAVLDMLFSCLFHFFFSVFFWIKNGFSNSYIFSGIVTCVLCLQSRSTKNYSVYAYYRWNDTSIVCQNSQSNAIKLIGFFLFNRNWQPLFAIVSSSSPILTEKKFTRTFLKYLPTGRVFSMCQQITSVNS